MRRTRTTILAAVLVAVASSPAFAESLATEWTFQNAFVNSERGTELGYIFTEFERDPTFATPSMLDLLMEVSLYSTQVLPYSQKDLYRIVAILHRADNPRYRLAMERLATITADPGPYERWQGEWRENIAKLAAKFAKRHAKTTVPQYQPGTISIERMRANYLAAALSARHTAAQAQRLLALANGASLDDIFTAAGAPEAIDIGTERGTYKGQRTRNEDVMQFYYRGLGSATLYYDKETGWHFATAQIDPLRVERAMPYRARAAEFGQPDEATLRMHELLSGSVYSIRQAMESAAPEEMSLEFSDTAAEVLLRGFPEQSNSQEGDAWLAICRSLARKDAERYAFVVAKVASESTDVRLQGLGSVVTLGSPADPANQYMPGALSLESQRRRYPPLYPDVTLQASP